MASYIGVDDRVIIKDNPDRRRDSPLIQCRGKRGVVIGEGKADICIVRLDDGMEVQACKNHDIEPVYH